MVFESHLYRDDGEKILIKKESRNPRPFEEQVNEVPEEILQKDVLNKDLKQLLFVRGWPTDEATCEVISIKTGIPPNRISAVSRYYKFPDAKAA